VHGRRVPLPAASRGDASPVQSGGDLSERLGAGGLGLSNSWHDCIGVCVGPCLLDGVADDARGIQIRI